MGQKDIVRQITDFIPTIDYSMSIPNESVSLFETTIRYLGGMLSGYDLLTGPLKSYNVKVCLISSFWTWLTKFRAKM